MSNIFYYCDPGLIQKQNPQTKYGPLDNSTDKNFRVTNLHSSSTDNPAYAVCDGFLFMQLGEGSSLNLILKPMQETFGNGLKIQYVIYKGIKKSSLLESDSKSLLQDDTIDLLRLVWQTHQRLEEDRATYQEPAEANPNAEKIFRLNSLDNQDPLDNLYYNYDPAFQPFMVKAGVNIGHFQASSFSVQFCTEPLGKSIRHVDTQVIDSIISYSEIQGNQTAAEGLALEQKKQQVLSFYDASSFYSGFVQTGVNIVTGGVVSKVHGAELYEKVLSKFETCQTMYINLDCIESRDFSSKNYLANDVQLKHDSSYETLAHQTNSWPLCIFDCSNWISDSANQKSLYLKLALNKQLNLNGYLQSTFRPKSVQSARQKNSFFRFSADENTLVTNEVELVLPVIDDSGSIKVLGGHVNLVLKKRESWFQPLTDGDTTSQNESMPEHYLNQLFYPIKHSSLLPSSHAKSQMRYSQQVYLLENGVDFQGVFNCQVAVCKDASHYYFIGYSKDNSLENSFGNISSDLPETCEHESVSFMADMQNNLSNFQVTHSDLELRDQSTFKGLQVEHKSFGKRYNNTLNKFLPIMAFSHQEMERMTNIKDSQNFTSEEQIYLTFKKKINSGYDEIEVFLSGTQVVGQDLKTVHIPTDIHLIYMPEQLEVSK